jgi:two-component system, chemotaxis family, chemotaxis protein CheY
VAGKTILIVDDEWMVVEVLDDLFGNAGYATFIARDDEQALALLAVVHPDLILTDLLMPVLDGFGLCRAVLADPATQTIPLVLMSAVYDLHRSIDFPIAGFLLKPFQIDQMLGLVAALVGSPVTSASR